ncbi:MAG: alanine--tRNA ligase [Thermoleophilia bacterium]|nr:alanine--tRNA ligase [Thermoleophilia bacterium]
MTSAEIRRSFLEYFEKHGHMVLPSASLIPFEDDPTVLLTIAGMQPLKSYFMGTAEPPAPRLASAQKCFRTNDIDEVGHTARHLTFFEMLGNFSLGDYFKEAAITFGFELSTEVFGLDPEQIWITVFEGMDGVPADDEAVEYWVELGIPPERIQALGESENFWKAGPTGPCGPNTELYFDRGEAFGPPGGPATGTDRFLEYWNLVFMQYERSADGELSPLPKQNIDTGAGLERIAALLQDQPSVFETDAFRPLITWAEQQSGRRYGSNDRHDRALRVLADHGRAMTFLATDGVRPGNEGRDYVMRRIIRRAVSEANHLGLPPETVVGLSGAVADGWGDAYPELVERSTEVADVLGAEAEQFARTLTQGQRMLENVLSESEGSRQISGDDAFRLFDTYGFPLDLTLEAAGDRGLEVDREAFEALMEGQRARSRQAAASGASRAREDAPKVAADGEQTRFVGYDALEVETTVSAMSQLDEREALVKLAESPFYAEGGGQISDAGTITGRSGTAEVIEVFRLGDDQVIHVRLDGELAVGGAVRARVDAARRRSTQANHTATHVLNWALRQTLGDGVRQAGSYVGPDKLRFDFTHRGKVAAGQLQEIEAMVGAKVAADEPVGATVMSREQAEAQGAIGLFEEKYGEQVRVVSTGEYSKELCGGTHVASTGEIGAFKLLSEGSVGAGARRIEALTGGEVARWYREREQELLRQIAERDERLGELEAQLKQATTARVDPAKLIGAAQAVGAVTAVTSEVELHDAKELLALSDRVRRELGDHGAVVLGSRTNGKAMLVANFSSGAVASGLDAGAVIGEIAPIVGGGGGGKPEMARAGGKDAARLGEALSVAAELIKSAAHGT